MKIKKIQLSKKPKYIKLAEDIDFFQMFEKIEHEFASCFIFESLGEEGNLSRYSVIGFDPQQIISARENILTINNKKYKVKNPYFMLREIIPQDAIARNYTGGLVGYLSYDAVNYFEQNMHVKVHDDFEQFVFGVYADGLVFDKITNELFYFYYADSRISEIKELVHKSSPKKTISIRLLGDSLTKEEHRKIVEKVKEQIKAGNTFQCTVGFKSRYDIKGSALLIYEKLRNINPSPFMYYLKFDDKKIIGASPELLFSLRDGEMTTRPLAGTIKRGKNEKEDKQLARQLLNDPKEKAEHKMLVDLHRNDLGRVAKFGTVKVTDLMSVKKFSHVQHISSEIVGLIRNDEDMFSGLAANFPAGTLSGAPKIESMKIIDSNEKEARGPYGGAVGHFGFNGDCTFAIALRTLFVSGQKAYTQAGSGVVYDSVSENEYDEIQKKLTAMKEVLHL